MDIASIIGIIIGLIAILGGQMLESGDTVSIVNPAAAIIVFGGTVGAVLLNFPFRVIVNALISTRKAFFSDDYDIKNVITQIVNLSDVTRREGNLVLEPIIQTIENPFLRKGVQLVADSANPRVIKEIMKTQIDYEEETYLLNARVFEVAGSFAPTFGIVGAVLGLIQVMQHISEPNQLGTGIATAFIATVYGVGIANLLLLPLGGKIRIKAREEMILKEMIIEGILSIHSGENPAVVEEKLTSFLNDHQKQIYSDQIIEPEGI